MAFEGFTASAPGKVILAGEHAVVHGAHAVATVLDKRTFVSVSPLNGRDAQGCGVDQPLAVLDLVGAALPGVRRYSFPLSVISRLAQDHDAGKAEPEIHERLVVASREVVGSVPKQDAEAVTAFVYLSAALVGATPPAGGFRLVVRSHVPVSAGLGSSASYCVALSTALLHLGRVVSGDAAATDLRLGQASPSREDKAVINHWAYRGERIIHGNPSGVDNTVSVHGGALIFRRGYENEFLSRLPPVRFLVTNTRVGRDTKRLVAGVGELLKRYPGPVRHMIDAMDEIALTLVGACREYTRAAENGGAEAEANSQRAFIEECGRLMTVNQNLLNGVGVGHPAIDQVVNCASVRFGLPTKLTGAGGGGCVISLVPGGASKATVAEFEAAMSQLGFEVFESTVGQEGALLYPGDSLDRFFPPTAASVDAAAASGPGSGHCLHSKEPAPRGCRHHEGHGHHVHAQANGCRCAGGGCESSGGGGCDCCCCSSCSDDGGRGWPCPILGVCGWLPWHRWNGNRRCRRSFRWQCFVATAVVWGSLWYLFSPCGRRACGVGPRGGAGPAKN